MPGSSLPGSATGGRPYNLAIGPPFRSWPVVRTALDAFSLITGALDTQRLSGFLRSQFLIGGAAEGPLRARFDAWLRRHNVSSLRLEALPGLVVS